MWLYWCPTASSLSDVAISYGRLLLAAVLLTGTASSWLIGAGGGFMLCSVGTREVLLHSPDCATASEEEPSVAKTIALSLAPWGSEYSP